MTRSWACATFSVSSATINRSPTGRSFADRDGMFCFVRGGEGVIDLRVALCSTWNARARSERSAVYQPAEHSPRNETHPARPDDLSAERAADVRRTSAVSPHY